jgi:thiol:disulfide interchange protein DsbD
MKNFRNLLVLLVAIFFSGKIAGQVIDPVHWKVEYKALRDKTGKILFTATIDKGYHLYGVYFEDGGPVRTHFSFPSSDNYELLGKLNEETKPLRKIEPAFDNMEITFHRSKAIFSQQIKLKSSNSFLIPVTVEYMTCTDSSCLPPVSKILNVLINPIKLGTTTTDSSELSSNTNVDKNSSIDTNSKILEIKSSPSSNEQDSKSNENNSLIHFLIIAFLAGLAGVLTPCVFPMIPMTVSYFMRDSTNKSKSIVNGLLFGLSITFLYTLVGILVSLTSLGAGFAAALSYHWIPNLIFFILFLIFSLSFLGLFEIILPSNLVNAADKNADKNGWIGIFFMAMVTVLVSFSCTGPIVGALLVEAAGKAALKPILGMAVFGLAFSLPFTFFAIFPSSLKNLPKSGGWLNEVKVVLGILMLAFGIKFLINIDQSYHFNIISRNFVLIFWIILAAFLGFYLLGKIRLKHDTPINQIGVLRLFLSFGFFYLSIYLFVGLMGRSALDPFAAFLPPEEKVYNSSENIEKINISTANICDKPLYSDILSFPKGISGYFDYKQAISCAKRLSKPVFIEFKAHSCSNCKQMDAKVLSNPSVQKILNDNFVLLALYTDERAKLINKETSKDGKIIETLGELNLKLEMEKFKTNALPLYAIIDTSGNILAGPIGTQFNITSFIRFLEDGIEKSKNE